MAMVPLKSRIKYTTKSNIYIKLIKINIKESMKED